MFLIGVPIYKYKPSLIKLLSSLESLRGDNLTRIVFIIQMTGDLNKIITTITESKLKTPHEIITNETNIGMVNNWNKIIEYAINNYKNYGFKYLIINHDDDFLDPGILNIYSKLLFKFNCGFIASRPKYLHGNLIKKIIKSLINHFPYNFIHYFERNDFLNYLKKDFTLACSSVAINIGLITSHNLRFSTLFPYSSDEEFWFKMLSFSPLVVIQKFLVSRTINTNGKYKNFEFETMEDKNFLREFLKCRIKIIHNYSNGINFTRLMKSITVKNYKNLPYKYYDDFTEFKFFMGKDYSNT